MYTSLAVFASLIGLFVTGAALFTAWSVYVERKARLASFSEEQAGDAETAGAQATLIENPDSVSSEAKPSSITPMLLQGWMVWDWAVVVLFGVGAVFLFTDLLAVARDREQYPPYHYGYLLCGFIFCVLGMLFAFVRIISLLSLNRGNRAARADHANEPKHADQAEGRI